MTIEEAIKHCEEVAEKQEITARSNLIEIDKIKVDGILRIYDADEYESCMKCASEHRQLAEWLRELKRLREQTRWIPVSKRLPKPHEVVLATYKRRGLHDNDLFANLPEYTYSTYFAEYEPRFGFDKEIIAWQPLPQPYKEEEE